MSALTGKPKLLKQANLSLIRKVIRAKNTATRAEIAKETKISSTTVRSLLCEMLDNGEIESIGYDESSGGRKAERYRFKPDRYYGAAVCITDSQICGLLINVCGEIVDTVKLQVPGGNYETAACSFLDEATRRHEIKVIGVGVPGLVEGGGYWRLEEADGQMRRTDIGDALSAKYGIPVILENDLNAVAIGFSRCYSKLFPGEDPEKINMGYLHFESGCVSAGFISDGRVIRGCNNFAGELGLIPADGDRLLDECIETAVTDAQYVDLTASILTWICGILNPQYIVLGGPAFRKDCLGPISDEFSARLPKHMQAEILYSPSVWNDYMEGIAFLTAGKMFDEIQLVKE